MYQNGGERHALLGLIPIEQLPLFNSLSQAQRGQLQGDIHMFNGQLRELVNEMNAQGKHAYFVDLHKAYLDLYGDVKQPSMDCSGQSDCKE